MTPAVGGTLGRYRLDALLGRGGMAEVFRATDTKLARTVAVKVILAAHAAEAHFLERFLREARMVASLEHPNILPVYDFGEESGVPFLVMPYHPGGSLRDRLKAGPVPLATASSWIAQLAGALDAAHAAGVLHRDVKPANVLLGKDDRLFLADFGIAKLDESQTGLTATGVVVGTPVYMAPEQAQGRPASPATDRYALAVVAFEILAGRPPFEGDNALSLMHQHVATPPPMLSRRVAGLPAGLDTVLARALAKDPSQRPATCRAFAAGVAAFAPAGVAAPRGHAGASVNTSANTAPTVLQAPTGEATVLTRPRRGTRAAVAGAGAIALLAGAWWVASRRGTTETIPAGITNAEPPGAVPTVPTPPAPAVAVVEKAPAPTPVPPLAPTRSKLVEKPAPAPPAAPELAGESDGRAHPLMAVRERLETARRHARRLSREDFQFALDEAVAVLEKNPRNPDAKYLVAYGRGGLAYLAGNDALASSLLVVAATDLRRSARRGARPAGGLLLRPDGTIGQPNAWELALGFGDARGEATGLLEKALESNPRDLRALRARAQLRQEKSGR